MVSAADGAVAHAAGGAGAVLSDAVAAAGTGAVLSTAAATAGSGACACAEFGGAAALGAKSEGEYNDPEPLPGRLPMPRPLPALGVRIDIDGMGSFTRRRTPPLGNRGGQRNERLVKPF